MYGCAVREASPSMSFTTGTVRQPSTFCPSATMRSLMTDSACARAVSSAGRNIMPTPYAPASGRVKPSGAVTSAMKRCGICSSIPAPSPTSGSAPVAPRWVSLSSTSRPCSTISCERTPLKFTTNPTPQLSFSRAGS